MQRNPLRVKKGLGHYNMRPYRRKIDGIWIVVPCSCCYFNDAKVRKLQKRLSKQKTLRSHRKGVERANHYGT